MTISMPFLDNALKGANTSVKVASEQLRYAEGYRAGLMRAQDELKTWLSDSAGDGSGVDLGCITTCQNTEPQQCFGRAPRTCQLAGVEEPLGMAEPSPRPARVNVRCIDECAEPIGDKGCAITCKISVRNQAERDAMNADAPEGQDAPPATPDYHEIMSGPNPTTIEQSSMQLPYTRAIEVREGVSAL